MNFNGDSSSIRLFDLDLRQYVSGVWDEGIPITRHYVIEGAGMDEQQIDGEELITLLKKFCSELNFHIVSEYKHQFSPQGLSVVLILEESHIAAHSWPEKGYLHLDIVTCTTEDTKGIDLVNAFKEIFKTNSTRSLKFIY